MRAWNFDRIKARLPFGAERLEGWRGPFKSLFPERPTLMYKVPTLAKAESSPA